MLDRLRPCLVLGLGIFFVSGFKTIFWVLDSRLFLDSRFENIFGTKMWRVGLRSMTDRSTEGQTMLLIYKAPVWCGVA